MGSRHIVDVTSRRPPSAERPMHAGSDGSKDNRPPPPLSVALATSVRLKRELEGMAADGVDLAG